jgi:hypothetical protein
VAKNEQITMINKTNKAAPVEPRHTDAIEPCIFTATDRKRLKKLLSKESFEQLMNLEEHSEVKLALIDRAGDGIDMLGPISINWWHDEGSQYIYRIGQRVYLYNIDGETFIYVESDVVNVIRECFPSEEENFEEACVALGIKPPLSSAKRGHEGICRVWINTFYKDKQTNSDSSRWDRGEDGKTIWFDSFSAARKWINQNKRTIGRMAFIISKTMNMTIVNTISASKLIPNT